MNELAIARRRVIEPIGRILPGRVSGYPRTNINRGVAPFVWLEGLRMEVETIGQSTDIWVATFSVHVIVDGASDAQVDQLDAIVTAIIDALEAQPRVEPRRVDPGDVAIDATHLLRGVVIEAAVQIAARTLCPPEAMPVAIPADPVPIHV